MSDYIGSGDPKMVVSSNGMDVRFENGVPLCDTGLSNIVTISLGTDGSTPLNRIARNGSESIGSTFIAESRKPITQNQIKIIEDAAEKSFSWAVTDGLIKSAKASMNYVKHSGYSLTITLSPLVGQDQQLVYLKNGENWIEQKKQG